MGEKSKASGVWLKDNSKIDNAEARGYAVFVVWEKDWKEDPEEVLNKVEEFWK